jgi:hypothetical protein
MGQKVTVRLAGVDEGRQVLARRDDFVAAMSPFDRQARLRTDRAVTADEHLRFAADQVVAWDDDEVRKIAAVLAAVGPRLEPWKLPLPQRVLLVKTTGQEEGHAAYTRGNAIMLPRRIVQQPAGHLERLLTHELFHVLSRHNPKLRDRLYAVVGFRPCGAVALPVELRERAITNPDAPRAEHHIELAHGGQRVHAVPVLYSTAATYDTRRGGEFFSYLEFRLMLVQPPPDDTGKASVKAAVAWQPTLVDGKSVLLDPKDVPSFHEQIGRNTSYIIHPEEVLADNFVLLMEGAQRVATPRVLDEMRKAMTP